MKIANDIVKTITDNYGPSFPVWQSDRIKNAVAKIDVDISNKLDYTDPNTTAVSLAKTLSYDITPYIVRHNYSVWVDLYNKPNITKDSNLLVITYFENIKPSMQEQIDRMKNYAEKIGADFVILEGRTQGRVQLEFARIKQFVEAYDRTIFLSNKIYIKDSADNLFDIIPSGKIGIHDNVESLSKSNTLINLHTKRRLIMFKAEYFAKAGSLTSNIESTFSYESEQMPTCYDSNVIVCDNIHSEIWNPINFFWRCTHTDINELVEASIYRDGYDVFEIPQQYNQSMMVKDKLPELISSANIVRYDSLIEDDNIEISWRTDNNIIGYQDKESMNMMPFKILVLTHKEEQRKSIEQRGYLEFIDLNNIGSKFDNSFTESRIYYTDFEYLFPQTAQYVGLVTGSWNLKYIGLNPIDQLHNWQAIRRLDNHNTLLCSNIETVGSFFGNHRTVLSEVFKDIHTNQMREFFSMIGIDVDLLNIHKYTGVSNQIIAKRDIVKSLFQFYQDNEILDKIGFFMDKYDFEIKERAYGGDAYARRSGFFSETATALWMAQNNFTLMPQEVLKPKWYDWKK